MMFKKIIFLFFILFTFSACQSVKDGLTGSKQTNTDEFLIEKKNPLVLPPEFDKLPEPKKAGQIEEEKIDIQKILKKQKVKKSSDSTNSNSSSSLEESILEKIKNN